MYIHPEYMMPSTCTKNHFCLPLASLFFNNQEMDVFVTLLTDKKAWKSHLELVHNQSPTAISIHILILHDLGGSNQDKNTHHLMHATNFEKGTHGSHSTEACAKI